MKRPKFFIIGAPKCGTTSLYYYLQCHPKIFLPKVKEPQHFAPNLNAQQMISREQYIRLFEDAHEDQLCGEASPGYLESPVAVEKIIEFDADARFIVMLRYPPDMAVSLHAHKVWDLTENVRDFSVAWALQDQRALGQDVPSTCPDSRALLYRDRCAFSSNLERLYCSVPHSQVKIVILEELQRNPASECASIFEFLGLDPIELKFDRHNPAKIVRSRFVALILTRISAFASTDYGFLRVTKRLTNSLGLHPLRMVSLVNLKTAAEVHPSAEVMDSLATIFEPEVSKVERILGRNIEAWQDRRDAIRRAAGGL